MSTIRPSYPYLLMVIFWIGSAFPISGTAQDSPFSRPTDAPNVDSDEARALQMFWEGKYADSIALAQAIDAKLGKFSAEEKWTLLIAQAQMNTGQYAAALTTVDQSLDRFTHSIRVRWLGIEAAQFSGQSDRADELLAEMNDMIARSSWRYRDPDSQIVLGKYFLKRHADAKEVLTSFYNPTKERYPTAAEVFRAIGDLAIEKHDYGLAADNFAKVVELLPGDPDGYFQLAEALSRSDAEKSTDALKQALAINPNHVNSLLLTADRQISSEDYDAAEKTLDRVLEVNPQHPQAWSYQAVLAHLDNDPAAEANSRNRALQSWSGNPEVDHIIGRELSEKYRFQEGETYQRRALVYDKNYLPAKMQLAHDLLRLGQELEGWKLADEVFDEDQYSVVAHNLVTLRDHLSKFRTLEGDGFVVRMDAAEAEIYGPRVLELLTRAKQELTEKYQSQLETPIFVEIFPQQQDFAIRTFGLPGGAGFLGVCFGRVITMNSPAAQGANLTSWESVLWHEFCHVVTLQKTKNRMPRWLSEGISVYEEKLADPAWGDTMSPRYREMILGSGLTPVSELSGAFLRPKTPLDLQFAYYESALVVEYLIEDFGLAALLNVLDELAIGTPINDALRRHTAPMDFIDKTFAEFAKVKAESFAPDSTWEEAEDSLEFKAEDWAKWNSDHPNNLNGLLAEAESWLSEKSVDRAITALKKVVELEPKTKRAYVLLARAFRDSNDIEQELATLETLATLESNSVELFTRLMEITARTDEWPKTKRYASKLLALNPLLSTPYEYLSRAAEKTSDDKAIIQALSVLAKMNPLDAADVHFRLASAYHRASELDLAKRQVILALEQAPRYRAAHSLLLRITEELTSKEKKSDDPSTSPSEKDFP